MGIAMTITFCFCITNLQDIVGPDATSFPIIQVIFNATDSYAATCVLGSLLVVLLFFSTVTTIASASRQVWAFSRDRVGDPRGVPYRCMLTRDQGFPCSFWIGWVKPGWDIPVNAVRTARDSCDHQS